MPTTQWHNPVQTIMGKQSLDSLSSLVGKKQPVIITDKAMVDLKYVDLLDQHLGVSFKAIWSDIAPNPTVASCQLASNSLSLGPENIVIALGGGSVIDTAKAVCAGTGLKKTDNQWLSSLLRSSINYKPIAPPIQFIAIPTTSGTGSEVTMWATIWDEISGKKYSLSHESLFPKAAVLCPALTASLPKHMTVFTALDAMSHAMESIWNKNSNQVSFVLAAQAIKTIHDDLENLIKDLDNISLRESIQNASLLAGLAFSATRTALAHSISYPLTAALNMPHGLACSFTLPEILALNAGVDLKPCMGIASALGTKSIDAAVIELYDFFTRLGIAEYLDKYILNTTVLGKTPGKFISPGRADNNLSNIDEAGARALMIRAYSKLKGN